MATPVEPAKQLLPYLQRADELQKHDRLVAYYCRLYAMEKGLKIPSKERTKDTNAILISLMGQLEKDKKAVALSPDDNMYVEGFAQSVFSKADKQDRAGRADLTTAKTFYAAGIFFEVCRQFAELQPELEQKQKYAIWKAADIRKALSEGRKPIAGPPGGDPEEFTQATNAPTTPDSGEAPGGAPPPPPIGPSSFNDYSGNFPPQAASNPPGPLAGGGHAPPGPAGGAGSHGPPGGPPEEYNQRPGGGQPQQHHHQHEGGSSSLYSQPHSASSPSVDEFGLPSAPSGPPRAPGRPAYGRQDSAGSDGMPGGGDAPFRASSLPPHLGPPMGPGGGGGHGQLGGPYGSSGDLPPGPPYSHFQQQVPQHPAGSPSAPLGSPLDPSLRAGPSGDRHGGQPAYPGPSHHYSPSAPLHLQNTPHDQYSSRLQPPPSEPHYSMSSSSFASLPSVSGPSTSYSNLQSRGPGGLYQPAGQAPVSSAPPSAPASTTFLPSAVATNGPYDSSYQPPPEKVSEAHKSARFAVSALAFDDVPTAISYLQKAMELLTSPSATL
eukprot:jgi/Mesen1/8971/ME000056S08379